MAGYTRQSAATIISGADITGNALGVNRTVGFYCEVPITGW